MALTADSPQVLVTGDMNSIPIIKKDTVYEGAMVGIEAATGHGRPLVAGDIFAGHSIFKVDNELGQAGGEKNIRLRTGKYRLLCTLAGTIDNVGEVVYATDDETLHLIATVPEDSSYVGRVSRYVSDTKMEIEFDTLQPFSKTT